MIFTFAHDNEKKHVPLVIKESLVSPSASCFTVVVGKNGVGKSRLLSALATETTKAAQRHFFSANSYHPFRRVIAVSTSPFDIFPLSRKFSGDSNSEDKYSYVGMRSRLPFGNTSSIGLIASAARGLLSKYLEDHDNLRLISVFELLGFSSDLDLIFKLSSKFEGHRSPSYFERTEKEDGLSEEMLLEVELTLKELQKLTDHNENFVLKFSLETTSYSIKERKYYDRRFMKKILFLLDKNIIRLIDVRLNKHEHGSISLRRASSGEQCMLVSMLGIASYISDDSLILIDEPEISLHPEWQEKYFEILHSAFSHYKRCQFVIATHSPQIVASLPSKNCFILSLSENEIYDSRHYQNKSSDFQLAELFGAPGSNNEYLGRLAMNLFLRVSKSKTFSTDDQKMLRKLKNLSKSLPSGTAITELIFSLSEMEKYEWQ
ncbi:AAA domain-containing protein, putative AbiEii toxin, Type IV TA system [Collimonas sp. OK242]|uniref:AAA family ATPase n=1 Tax=Collimonas sp. OK242 TaxID=1798195 RepID=UPI00089B83B4|nr:AAA family ATPase [Collimonas sp. OK242]SDY80884.1 AAA domain-containing protein, putative AbiEii toxin, Type IV TA system [Collimonas sp. OK242]